MLYFLLGYANKYGVNVIVDVHGLPGSQNGQDNSGHKGTIGWYSAENLNRTLAVIEAAATWIASSIYLSIIVAIEIDNEPQIANYSQWLYYKNYVVSANTIIKNILPSMATMFHDGWWGYGLWQSYFSASDNVVIDMHNYWAFSSSNASDAINGACAFGQTVNSSHIPIFVGEFSLSFDGITPGTVTWGQRF